MAVVKVWQKSREVSLFRRKKGKGKRWGFQDIPFEMLPRLIASKRRNANSTVEAGQSLPINEKVSFRTSGFPA